MTITIEDVLRALEDPVYVVKHSSDDSLLDSTELWDSEAVLFRAEIDNNERGDQMKFDDVVFTGNVEGMTLYRKLVEYARDNDIHDSDDIDIVCHCDFCQVFLPMAAKMEKFIRQVEERE